MQNIVKNKVYKLRIGKSATQEELANAVGVSRQTIIAIEKNNYKPSVELAIKIAKYFKVLVDDVFWLE